MNWNSDQIFLNICKKYELLWNKRQLSSESIQKEFCFLPSFTRIYTIDGFDTDEDQTENKKNCNPRQIYFWRILPYSRIQEKCKSFLLYPEKI